MSLASRHVGFASQCVELHLLIHLLHVSRAVRDGGGGTRYEHSVGACRSWGGRHVQRHHLPRVLKYLHPELSRHRLDRARLRFALDHSSPGGEGDEKRTFNVGASRASLKCLAYMLIENAVNRLSPGEKPMVVSPLGVPPKLRTNKLWLSVNIRYVNRHMGKMVFKFKRLKHLANSA